jgi:hypothetical protein
MTKTTIDAKVVSNNNGGMVSAAVVSNSPRETMVSAAVVSNSPRETMVSAAVVSNSPRETGFSQILANANKEHVIADNRKDFSLLNVVLGLFAAAAAIPAAVLTANVELGKQMAGLGTVMVNSQAKSNHLKEFSSFLQNNDTIQNSFLFCCKSIWGVEVGNEAIDGTIGAKHFYDWATQEDNYRVFERALQPSGSVINATGEPLENSHSRIIA